MLMNQIHEGCRNDAMRFTPHTKHWNETFISYTWLLFIVFCFKCRNINFIIYYYWRHFFFPLHSISFAGGKNITRDRSRIMFSVLFGARSALKRHSCSIKTNWSNLSFCIWHWRTVYGFMKGASRLEFGFVRMSEMLLRTSSEMFSCHYISHVGSYRMPASI